MGSNPSAQSTPTDEPIDMQKFVILGSENTGKSAILNCLLCGQFKDNTPIRDFGSITIEVDGQQATIDIWDTSGEERFSNFAPSRYRGTTGIVLVFNVADRKTFDDLNKWLEEAIRECGRSIPIILIGNHCDLSEKRTVTVAEAEQFAQRHELYYIEASPRDATSFREAFVDAARSICRKAPRRRILTDK